MIVSQKGSKAQFCARSVVVDDAAHSGTGRDHRVRRAREKDCESFILLDDSVATYIYSWNCAAQQTRRDHEGSAVQTIVRSGAGHAPDRGDIGHRPIYAY